MNPLMNQGTPGPINNNPGGMPTGPMAGQTNGGPMNFMQRMIFNKLYNSNPQFKQFADSMQGKTPEQAFQEQGLDYSQFQNVNPNQIKNMLGF